MAITNNVRSQVTSYNFDPNKTDKLLTASMDSLYKEDQQYRFALIKLEKEAAPQQQIDSLRKLIKQKDSSNLVFVTGLLDSRGWLGPQEIGFQGTQALFLIIQHAGLKTQKKYYPIILEAEKDGKILSSNVAILEDRIAIREGRSQTYGSQGFYDPQTKKNYTYPLTDLENIDSLRKSRGLQPMIEYKKDWSIEDYKANLPKAEAHLKKIMNTNK